MKINITKKQYWNLMRALYMADWMANAICEAGMKEDDDIKQIRDYIFSFAKQMGYGNYVTYDKETEKYYADFDLDDEPSARALIDRYDEYSFWDEAIGRFGERDFFNKYTEQEIKEMDNDERFIERMECDEKWHDEFEEHGIERLEINKKK